MVGDAFGPVGVADEPVELEDLRTYYEAMGTAGDEFGAALILMDV